MAEILLSFDGGNTVILLTNFKKEFQKPAINKIAAMLLIKYHEQNASDEMAYNHWWYNVT